MSALDITDLTTAFLQRSFTTEAALRFFGPAGAASSPNRIPIIPKDSDFREVYLELYEKRAGSRLLNGIVLYPSKPEPSWLAAAEKRFGTPVELPRIHPEDEISHRFDMIGAEFEGYLILSAYRRGGPTHSAIIRRFLKDD